MNQKVPEFGRLNRLVSNPWKNARRFCVDGRRTRHLIHMNGRIYDNAIGRFISPDPVIQEPNNLQSFNRYTYVMNRPLSLTDPSGFVSSGLEMVLGSGRSGGGGGGGGGNSENYAEPIMADPLSEQDSINTQSSGQDAETETTYEEVYDPFGYGIVVDVIETTVTIAGSGSGEETISTGSSSSSGVIDGGNGMGTGGGSGSLAQDNSASTGVTAEGLGKGDHTTDGVIQTKTEGKDPVGKATNSGEGNFGNGAKTKANDHAQGESSGKNDPSVTGRNGPNWHHQGRDDRNSNLPSSPEGAREQGGRKEDRQTFHDNDIGKPEEKYVFPDGREAVYDGDTGDLINDNDLKGTYNYVNPGDWSLNPLSWPGAAASDIGHTAVDVVPYLIFGN